MTTMNAPDTGGSPNDRLRAALKRSTSALKAASVPFALAGSYALWVHGAPENTHDVDLVVAEDTTEDAVGCLAEDGFRIERPPEDWLFKAYLDAAIVDVLHRLNGVPVQRAFVEDAEVHDVLGLRIPVLAPTEVLSTIAGHVRAPLRLRAAAATGAGRPRAARLGPAADGVGHQSICQRLSVPRRRTRHRFERGTTHIPNNPGGPLTGRARPGPAPSPRGTDHQGKGSRLSNGRDRHAPDQQDRQHQDDREHHLRASLRHCIRSLGARNTTGKHRSGRPSCTSLSGIRSAQCATRGPPGRVRNRLGMTTCRRLTSQSCRRRPAAALRCPSPGSVLERAGRQSSLAMGFRSPGATGR